MGVANRNSSTFGQPFTPVSSSANLSSFDRVTNSGPSVYFIERANQGLAK